MAARRNGYPAWLWPEVDVEEWRLAVAVIENATRTVFAREPCALPAGLNARTIGLAGYTSGMGPLLGYWIASGTVTAEKAIGDTFDLHLSHNRRRMERLNRVSRAVTERLAERNISPLILKGMDTAYRYFPEPGTRPLSDIDMYIPIEAMSKAERVLSDLGYRRVPRTRRPYACDWIDPSQPRAPHTLTFVHEEDPWSIDLLGSLDKRLTAGQCIKLSRLLPYSEAAESYPGASVMSQPLLSLYLAAHISQMLLNVTVLRVLELATVIREDGAAGKLDWDQFLDGAAAIGGGRFVYPALAFVEKLSPKVVPAHLMTAVAADAPENLRAVVDGLTVASAQPLHRHSVRERFMWASTGRQRLRQIASEVFVDGQGRPLGSSLYSIGSKLWALRRGRYAR